MNKRVIANPPIGFYDNFKTKTKHGFFLYLADTIARKKTEIGENVIFPNYSFNMFGKKSESLIKSEGKSLKEYHKNIKELSKKLISENDLRYLFNLTSDESLFDNEDEIIRGISEDFIKLNEKGYLLTKGTSNFLDCNKINQNFNLQERIESIKIPSRKAKSDLERFIQNNLQEPHKITRDTFYSIRNPIDENMENISPLFILANLWDYKYPDSKFTFLSSDDVLAKHIFLRFITKLVLDNDVGFDELVVWPRVNLSGEKEKWDISNLIKDEYDSDVFRISLLSLYPSQKSSVNLDYSKIRGNKNFLYSLANLRRIIPYSSILPIVDNLYTNQVFQFRYPCIIEESRIETKEISKEVNRLKPLHDGNLVELSKRYSILVDKLAPFVPATVDLIRKESVKK